MRFLDLARNNFKGIFFPVLYFLIAIVAIGIIDDYIKKSEIAKYEKCYNAFKPLMKYKCFVGIDLTTDSFSRSIKCNDVLISTNMNNEISKLLTKSNNQFYNLKNDGCISIEIYDNMVQLWYKKYVVDIEYDSAKKSVISDISDLK
jgi:hypothetical protein